MYFNKYFFALLLPLLCCGSLASQTVKGYVYGSLTNGGREALPMATVYWMGGAQALQADERGFFSIDRNANTSSILIASLVGYQADTLEVADFSQEVIFALKPQNVLDDAVITGRQSGHYLSRIAPVRTEVISATGLNKMACCNLAKSFENSASISVGYADAITGARQIRLLGLSGIYVQMLDENRPTMRGLLTPFGLSFAPSYWLESIQIAKGTGSVVNGYEAITGQINLEYRKPPLRQPLYVNLYLMNSLKADVNVASSLQLNQKWSTALLGHFSTNQKPHDSNQDGFLDAPLTNIYNFANRWFYIADNGLQWRFGLRAVHETREAGQHNRLKTVNLGTPLWKSIIKNQGINLYSKIGIPLKPLGTKTSAIAPNVAFVVDYTHHAMNSYFGLKEKNYNAVENSIFANLMFQLGIKEAHRFNFGLGGFYDHINEDLSGLFTSAPYLGGALSPQVLGREEHAWGAYGEYTYNQNDKFVFILGSRVDYNNFHGWLFTPRTNIKYDFTDNLIFRATGGKGYRTSNPIADNPGVLSTGRWLRFDNNLNMEQAWTYGANLTGYFQVGNGEKSSLSLDYFHSDFTRQVIVDQERDLNYVWFYNLDGRSYSNTYQIDLTLEPIERFSILTTFRFTDSRIHLAQLGIVERPLMSKYKGVFNVQYATRMSKWIFDVTAQLNGPSRLPYFANSVQTTPSGVVNPEPEYSPVYPMFYAQVTRRLRGVDIYIGGENLANYIQPNPIIDAQNPFSRDFNATVIWGPLMGMKVYVGLRYTLYK